MITKYSGQLFNLIFAVTFLTSACSRLLATPEYNSKITGLGDLCTGWEKCLIFCQSHQEECQEYCRRNHQNDLCLTIFPSRVEVDNYLKTPTQKAISPSAIPAEVPCDKPLFTEYLVDLNYVHQIGQIGTVHGSGQFTVGRSYISIKEEYYLEKISLFAPTDMVLTSGAHYQVLGVVEGSLPDYALNFDAGCGVEVSLAHLKEVIPEIADQLPEVKPDSRTSELEPVELYAGDLIGYFILSPGIASFDFMVHDASVVNEFGNQARHDHDYSDHLLHAVCPYDFYQGTMKDNHYNLIGGKDVMSQNCGPVSRDFPGTISGLWFLNDKVTGSMYDYDQDGFYGSVLPLVGDINRVIIGKMGDRATTFSYPNFPTYQDPKDVTDEHCYQIHPDHNPSEWNGYIYFKLMDEETLKVIYSPSGDCPVSFPETGWEIYYR